MWEKQTRTLAEFRQCGWIEAQPGIATQLEVKVRGPATNHTVSLQQIQRWAESTAVTPADRVKRESVKRLLSGTPKFNRHSP